MHRNNSNNKHKIIALALSSAIASTYGHAQESTKENTEAAELDTIIVTAQKIEQKASKVPLAVSVVEGNVLDRTQVSTVENLRFIAPSLSFSQSTSRRGAGMGIRGLSTLSFSDGIEQSVGTVVDGVVLGRQAQGFTDFFDVDRIEVLRGPQGTLFGKNSSAGLINIITKDPSEQLEGKAELSYGNENDIRFNGLISGPFSDTVGGRLSIRYQNRDGFTQNVATGEKTDGEQEFGLRGKIKIANSDKFDLTLAADVGRSNSECCNITLRSASPGYLAAYVNNVVFAGGPQSQIVPSISNRDVAVDAPTGTKDEGGGIAATANWHRDFGTVTSITSFRDFKVEDFVDVDQGPRNIFNISGTDSDIVQWSQELRVSGKADQPFQYVAGLYLFDQTLKSAAQFGGRLQAAPFTPGGVGTPVDLITRVNSEIDTRSMAAFGQATYTFENGFSLTGGLRFTREDLEIRQSQRPGFPLIGGGISYDLPSAAFPNAVTDVTDNNVSGKFAVGYEFREGFDTFVSYTRGYKGPGFNSLFLSSLNQAQTFADIKPEIPTQLEAGLRTRSFNNRLDVDFTLFSTTIENFQGQATRVGVLGFLTVNAGEQKSQGAELEIRYKPIPDLYLYLNGSYIDAKFTDFANAQCYPGQTVAQGCVAGVQNLTGKPLNNSPKLSGNFGAQYNFTWLGDKNAYVRGELSGRSDVIYSLNQNPRTRQGGFGLTNLYFGTSLNSQVDVSVFIRNVFDKNYAETIFQTPLDNLNTSQVLGNPRNYGVRLTWVY
jgi:iron complex outermembrane recepter protein